MNTGGQPNLWDDLRTTARSGSYRVIRLPAIP